MVEATPRKTLAFRLLYVAICVGVMFVALLPLDAGPGGWPGPDLILGLSIAWVIRRPDYVPMLLVAGVLLLADLMLMRPPGLAAGISLIAIEFLRSRVAPLRSVTMVQDWITASVVIASVGILVRLAQWAAVLPNPPLVHDLVGIVMTCAAYPVLVAVSAVVLSVRKVTAGEMTGQGGAA